MFCFIFCTHQCQKTCLVHLATQRGDEERKERSLTTFMTRHHYSLNMQLPPDYFHIFFIFASIAARGWGLRFQMVILHMETLSFLRKNWFTWFLPWGWQSHSIGGLFGQKTLFTLFLPRDFPLGFESHYICHCLEFLTSDSQIRLIFQGTFGMNKFYKRKKYAFVLKFLFTFFKDFDCQPHIFFNFLGQFFISNQIVFA